ncbi:TPA: hypothetical protein MIV21_08540 [Klebsiella pneumoniae]|nr:hypothetical protein [Klebsiella pneumoniae]
MICVGQPLSNEDIMACSGCARRREWIKKWTKIAYERATGKRADRSVERADSSTERANGSDKPSG